MTPAQRFAGEVQVRALGQTWTMVAGLTASCEIELEFDKPAVEVISSIIPKLRPDQLTDEAAVLAEARGFSAVTVQRVLLALLRLHHPEIDKIQLGRIIGEVGLDKMMALMLQASLGSLPPPEAGEARPPRVRQKRRTGTA